MVKILLTSDLHLGADTENSPVPESFRLKTFRKLSYLAKSHDLFIIAGDLFHSEGINDTIIETVAGEFKSLRESGVEIIYALGEHELGVNDLSFLTGLNISKIFSDSDDILPYRFSRDDQEIYIYGLPAYGRHSISEIKRNSGRGFHIGLFHTDFYLNGESKTSKIRTLNKEDIASLDLDFYALGHNHQFKLYKLSGRYIGAYPGSPEAASFNENGDRYCLSIIIRDNEIIQIKRLTVNSAKLETIVFDCSFINDSSIIIQTLKEKMSSDKIIKIILTGKRNFRLDQDEIEKLEKDYLDIRIEDKSFLTIDLFTGEFAGEKTLRGEFFNILNERINNNEMPAEIDVNTLSEILNKVINSGLYTLEDLCNYLNA